MPEPYLASYGSSPYEKISPDCHETVWHLVAAIRDCLGRAGLTPADVDGLAGLQELAGDATMLFYATEEADAPDEAKKRIVAASGDDTVRGLVFDISRDNVWPLPFTGRCLVNDHSRRWHGREGELLANLSRVAAEYHAAKAAEDFNIAAVIAGVAAGMIKDMKDPGKSK